MARGHTHLEPVVEQMLDDPAAEKASPAKDGDDPPTTRCTLVATFRHGSHPSCLLLEPLSQNLLAILGFAAIALMSVFKGRAAFFQPPPVWAVVHTEDEAVQGRRRTGWTSVDML